MVYQIRNGLVRYAAETIIENINFEIRNTEKIAVIGRNGCGKTTLFKLIAGMLSLDNTDSEEECGIYTEGKPVIGYLQQNSFEDENLTAEEEIRKAFSAVIELEEKLNEMCRRMETDHSQEVMNSYSKALEQFEYLGGYTYASEIDAMLNRFGFELNDRKRPIASFSGGQKTKLAFIRLLLGKPDIMLLDEPTNHLDLPTIEWLEGYLKLYPKAVVIISHDRMFLDRVTEVTYEIEYKKMTRYQGNYSAFVKQKQLNWEKQQKDYLAQQREIERLTAIIEKFKHHPTKVAMTKSKLKQIEHMEIVEAPANYDLRSFHAEFEPLKEGGKTVLKADRLVIGYDKPLSKVSFELKKGQKLAILGSNGIGKSTLLKTLIGQLEPLAGSFSYGFQIEKGYYDQQLAQFTSEKTVLEDFWDEYPDMRQSEVRTALGCFLFTQEEVFKKVSQLSGGEKVRLYLAKMFRKRPNLLILDEPTNHMDIVGKEALEALLKDYKGTVLCVSHDRYFVQKFADSLLLFENEGVRYYPYGYLEYMEKNLELNNINKGDMCVLPKKHLTISKDQSQEKGEHGGQITRGQKQDGQKQDGQKQDGQKPKGQIQGGQIMGEQIKGSQKRDGQKWSRQKKAAVRLEALMEETEKEINSLSIKMQEPEIACDYMKLNELNQRSEEAERTLLDYLEKYEQLTAEG